MMGSVAPVVMSLIVFSGAAQFAALTVLTAGGGAVAAIAAGMLMNGRWLPMGLAIGPFLTGGPLKRAAQSLALVDASFALSSRGDGTYDRGVLIGATIPQAAAWVGGTLIGVLSGRCWPTRAPRPGRDVPGLLRGAAGGRGARPACRWPPRDRRRDRARADALRAARRPSWPRAPPPSGRGA